MYIQPQSKFDSLKSLLDTILESNPLWQKRQWSERFLTYRRPLKIQLTLVDLVRVHDNLT
jgi:hypothetical protein